MNTIVTGGSRGIGKAIVRSLRAQGHKVAVISRTKPETDCDLWVRQDLYMDHSGIVDYIVNKLGDLDILVNNAGVQVKDPDVEQFRYQLDLMVTVPYALSMQAAKHMKRGHIINILSISSFQAGRHIAGYVAAKHGLLGLTRALALELAPDIHVNAVAPGLIETAMTANLTQERRDFLNSITPAGEFGKPEDIAGAVMYLIGSNYIYGQTIIVDGGWLIKNG